MINPTKFLHYYPSLVNTSTVYRSFPQSPYSFQFQPISCYPLFSSEIRSSRNYRKLRQNSAHNSAALTVATTVTLALLFQHKMEGVDALIHRDKLVLKGLSFYGFHGVLKEEKILGQKFFVDIDAWMDLKPAGKSDNLSDSFSYVEIYRIAKEVIEGPAHNLLESVAQKIAISTLEIHKEISAVRVKVGKPHVAIPDPFDYLGVEILRRRSDLTD
ncbi:unnamed protein product [Vicia faba]|uniref:7,8-dihydroneopterin aldolase n=1 Tax=Vicia faba TaxID=3906 RepID=A0AAV1AXG2_VICFA|nr:unnamed protein product [Vicia faba]